MALADRVAQRTALKSNLCPLGRLLTELKGKELDALKTALGTREQWGLTAPEIHADLQAEGYKVGFKAINRHRGGKCRCDA